jgi:hypothetical protein
MRPEDIYSLAYTAGMDSMTNATIVPMVVGTPTTPLGSDIDESKPVYVVEGGPCGFAWVNIRPARGTFVSWLKKNKIGGKAYEGGYNIWVHEGGQSLARKEAFGRAFAKVLKSYGVSAYCSSRMD